jgi:dihydroorotase
VDRVDAVLARMAEVGMPLLVHGEVTDPSVDVFEREPVFLERIMRGVIKKHPSLKVVMEHITTKEAVAFVREHGPNVAATVTAHHLLFNRNALFEGGLRPHRYCLPVLKHESDRKALVDAVTSGDPKFFLGTDSAPHPRGSKECGCGAAGMFTAHAALEIYATVFEAADALQHLRAFACENGPRFYGMPLNADRLPSSTVFLRKETWKVPDKFEFGGYELIPLGAGEEMAWKATVETA